MAIREVGGHGTDPNVAVRMLPKAQAHDGRRAAANVQGDPERSDYMLAVVAIGVALTLAVNGTIRSSRASQENRSGYGCECPWLGELGLTQTQASPQAGANLSTE